MIFHCNFHSQPFFTEGDHSNFFIADARKNGAIVSINIQISLIVGQVYFGNGFLQTANKIAFQFSNRTDFTHPNWLGFVPENIFDQKFCVLWSGSIPV
jgi:hypothetical protein